MPSEQQTQQVIEQLLEAIDQEGYPVNDRIRLVLREGLGKASLKLADGKLEGLTGAIWQAIFLQFTTTSKDGKIKHKSDTTRYRYQDVLNNIAAIWVGRGWMQHPPSLTLSKQRPRSLVLRQDKMGQYKFSDYLAFANVFLAEFTGCRAGRLVPESLAENYAAHLGLALILSGYCTDNPVESLYGIYWEDLNLDSNTGHYRRYFQHRKYYRWSRLPDFVRLMLTAWHYRQGRPASGQIFDKASMQLPKGINQLIKTLCLQNNLPKPSLEQLCTLEVMHLSQWLDNPQLAVSLGQLPYRPTATGLSGVDEIQTGITPPEAAIIDTERSMADAQPEVDEDALLAAYVKALRAIETDLENLFTAAKPKESIRQLEIWAAQHCNDEAVAYQNIARLVQWLIGMCSNRSVKPQSREVYWYAVKRIWVNFLASKLAEITREDLRQFVAESDLDEDSLRQAVNQWCALGKSLRLKGYAMPHIERKEVPVPADAKTVLTLNEGMIRALINQLDEPSLRWAVYLAARLGLRVSEICQLEVQDVVVGEAPCVYVYRSKGGKSRRVPLLHLRADELSALRRLTHQRPGQSLLLADRHGMPLDPQKVSKTVGAVLGRLYPDCQAADIPLRFHSLRAYALMWLYTNSEDVRVAASVAGHASVATTVGSYLSNIDLAALPKLAAWDTPLNRPDLHISVKVLAAMIGRTDRRVMQMIDEYNQAHPDAPLQVIMGVHLPDGTRPTRRGRPVAYLRLEDALRLIDFIAGLIPDV